MFKKKITYFITYIENDKDNRFYHLLTEMIESGDPTTLLDDMTEHCVSEFTKMEQRESNDLIITNIQMVNINYYFFDFKII